MATAKQVMDFRPSKGISTAQSNEHLRNWTQKGWDNALSKGNYDPTRERLNFEIRGGKVCPVDKTRSIPMRMAQNLKERGIKDPNEGLPEPRFRTVVNFIFGGSRERMNELAFGNQPLDLTLGADNSSLHRCKDIEEWAKDVYRFVAGKYGEENIVAFVVHLDEKNAHVHCTLLPIQEGRFAYKKIFAGADKYEFSARMKQLHDDYAKVNERWGMSRGSSIAETGAKHRTTEEYRRQLSEELTRNEQSIAGQLRTLRSLEAEIRLAERRVKGLSSMIENLKKERTEKEQTLAELQRQILSGRANPDELREQVAKLERELDAVQSKLDDKQQKLSEADHKLEQLREEMTDTKDTIEFMKQEAERCAVDLHRRVDIAVRDGMISALANDLASSLASLSPAERSQFDGSLIEAIAEDGENIIKCAVLLYLGYLDSATTFAEGHGGGGSSSDMKWGRDDDEDDQAWRRRCLMKAVRMMRPSSGKKQKR